MAKKDQLSAQDRREAQRAALREKRKAELKRQQRTRTMIIAIVAIIAVALVGTAGWFVFRSSQEQTAIEQPASVPEDQPYLSVGAPAGSDAPVAELHMDFMCPYCGVFEQTNGADLQELVANEQVTLNIVPRRFLDRASTTGDYSTRSANAAVCVYEENPDNLLPFMVEMYTDQPPEGSAGLTDEEITQRAVAAGASENVASCITDGTYSSWVKGVSEPHGSETGGGTPYLAINGTAFEGDWNQPGAVRTAIEEAGPQPQS